MNYRYLVFVGSYQDEAIDPETGGAHDLWGGFETLSSAEERYQKAIKDDWDWVHLFDLKEGCFVKEYLRQEEEWEEEEII